MPLKRRTFLKLSLTPLLLMHAQLAWPGILLPSNTPKSPNPLLALPALVDTLIPAGTGPGALSLGVDRMIKQAALKRSLYWKVLRAGCLWLNKQAMKLNGTDFAHLTEQQRIYIVQLAEDYKARTLPRVFFEQILIDTRRFYYSQPESWISLNYNGPPQPDGFPNATRRPGSHA